MVKYTGKAWFSPMESFASDIDLEKECWVLLDKNGVAVRGHYTEGKRYVFRCEDLEYVK